jgi:uncharacterized SAM-binding protein YcdF (DUF218 family)
MFNGSIAVSDDTKHAAKSKRRKTVLRLLVLILLIWPPLAWIAARGLIVRADMQKADAVVVLGGSSTFVERTRYAAEILKEGRVSKVLLTNDGEQGGWSNSDQRNPLFIERAKRELEAAGVPVDKIEALPQVVTSTYEEAVLLRQYAEAHGLRSILVVTSAYHSRRALWILRVVFEGSGVEIGIASPSTGLQTPPPATWWLHLAGWRMVAGEYVKLGYYHLRH